VGADPVVIAGAGHGGAKLAVDLRSAGHEGPITLISGEAYPPYNRPPLSKAYIKGDITAPPPLRSEKAYAKSEIDLRLDCRAVAIDRTEKTLRLDDDTALSYGRLVLATGARARPAPFAPEGTPGVFSLRTRADADRLRPALDAAERVAVVGGGLIGLEVAAVARHLGKSVTVVEAADRLMERTVSPALSRFFADFHTASGVVLRLGRSVETVESEGDRPSALVLDDGGRVDCDLVLTAIGAVPDTDLAEAAGLALDNGIRVDGALATSDPAIFALGDCVSFPSPRYGRRIRLESVQNAADQAAALASTLAQTTDDDAPAYDALPWFWSDQADAKLQIAGLAVDIDRWEMRGEAADGRVTVLGLRKGKLRVVETVNRPRDHMDARNLLRAGDIPFDSAMRDPDRRLADIAAPPPD